MGHRFVVKWVHQRKTKGKTMYVFNVLIALANIAGAASLWYYLIIRRQLMSNKGFRFGGVLLWSFAHIFAILPFYYDISSFMFICAVAISFGSARVAISCKKDLDEITSIKENDNHKTDYKSEILDNHKKANDAAKKLGYDSAINFHVTPYAKRKLPSDMSTEERHILEMTVLTGGRYDPTDYINEQKEKRRLLEEYKDRLIPQDEPPDEPPKYAIEGMHMRIFNDIKVLGTYDIEDKSFLPILRVNSEVNLKRMGDIGYDNNTYEVSDFLYRQLGYLEIRSDQHELLDLLKSDYSAWLIISKIDGEHIFLNIAFYAPFNEKYRKSKTFSLSGTNKKSLEYNIGYYLYGTEISFDYDCDKDKYAVYSEEGDIIGYLSSVIENIVDNEYVAFVSDVGRDDSLKWYVKVTFHYNPDNVILNDSKSVVLKPVKCKYCNVTSIYGKETTCSKCGAPLESD